MNNSLSVKGRVQVVKNGIIISDDSNLVVASGRAWVAQRMQGGSSDIDHIAVGTNSTSPTLADTSLGAEIARKAVTVSGGTRTGNKTVYTTSFAAGEGTGILRETGLFLQASGGTIIARTNLNFTKEATDVIDINWTIEVV